MIIVCKLPEVRSSPVDSISFEVVYCTLMFAFIMISLILAASIDADDPADDEVSEWEGERER